jgi:tetratricopeptide (TPR) repeat protein
VRKFLICTLFMMATPQAAWAGWHEASSDHFVIYANQSENDIRQYADRLERYHSAMEVRMGLPKSKPSPSNRVTVYVVKSIDEVQKLAGDDKRFIAGFYQPRAGGSVAFVPRIDTEGEFATFSEVVLLHEYAHHFFYTHFTGSYPLWFSEGFAEFYGTAKFEKGGSVGLGLPASHRAEELFFAKNVPIDKLLDTEGYLSAKTKSYDEFYGRSWLLFHYLIFSETRQDQLADYLKKLNAGTSEVEAARSAFGDLKQLDKDLASYLRQSRFRYSLIDSVKLSSGPIAVRQLGAAEAEIMPVRLQSKRGVNSEQAAALLPKAREIAAKYPDDPYVLSALAEAEFDAGNDDPAIAVADKALAAQPGLINAMIQKGYAMSRKAVDSKDQTKAWRDVRNQFSKVNKLENDNPIALIQYYLAYQQQGGDIPPLAVEGLEWSLELSPFDEGLRWMVAGQQMTDKNFAKAIATLKPLANSPHRSEGSEQARKLMAQAQQRLDGKTDSEAEEGAASDDTEQSVPKS